MRILSFITMMSASLGLSAISTLPAKAHPHVFADARLEIETSKDGALSEVRHVWRFDPLFSASVLLDFDENRNLKLDQDELEHIGEVVRQSLAEYDYYTSVSIDDKPATMAAPEVMIADYQNDQLLLIFAHKPKFPLLMTGKISVGVYDPTLYTAIDFINDDDLVVTGEYASKCKSDVVRPDADEVIAENQGSLTEAFYDEADAPDFSKLFATRIDFECS